MDCEITTELTDDLWQQGTVRPDGYRYEAKIYGAASEWGIDGGAISKLRVFDRNGEEVAHFERGWDLKPGPNSPAAAVLDRIVEFYRAREREMPVAPEPEQPALIPKKRYGSAGPQHSEPAPNHPDPTNAGPDRAGDVSEESAPFFRRPAHQERRHFPEGASHKPDLAKARLVDPATFEHKYEKPPDAEDNAARKRPDSDEASQLRSGAASKRGVQRPKPDPVEVSENLWVEIPEECPAQERFIAIVKTDLAETFGADSDAAAQAKIAYDACHQVPAAFCANADARRHYVRAQIALSPAAQKWDLFTESVQRRFMSFDEDGDDQTAAIEGWDPAHYFAFTAKVPARRHRRTRR